MHSVPHPLSSPHSKVSVAILSISEVHLLWRDHVNWTFPNCWTGTPTPTLWSLTNRTLRCSTHRAQQGSQKDLGLNVMPGLTTQPYLNHSQITPVFPQPGNGDTRDDASPVGGYCTSYTSPPTSLLPTASAVLLFYFLGSPSTLPSNPSAELFHLCYVFRTEDITLSPECLFFTAARPLAPWQLDGRKGRGGFIHQSVDL